LAQIDPLTTILRQNTLDDGVLAGVNKGSSDISVLAQLLGGGSGVISGVGEGRVRPYQLFILALSIYALAALSVEVLAPVSPETKQILEASDVAVCVFFLIDFFYQLASAPDRWGYFRRWGWLDLISSIPMIDALRVGRLARIVRILRVLRGLRSAKILATFILERRSESAFLAAALVSLLLVVFGSIAMLQFEGGQRAGNIKTAEDALWWAITTITTVGYGDRFPISTEGRLLAGVLMIAGVGLFGTLSGFIASWFLTPGRAREEEELNQLRAELDALRRSSNQV
jgi:voltage-gated potassium channel